jgi:hypothetical protein
MVIVVGLNNLYQYSETDVYTISSIVSHESYSGSSGNYVQNDIALVKVDRQVKKSDRVQTICLPQEDDSVIENYSIVSGWGNYIDGFESTLPENLQTLKLKIINNDPTCNDNGQWDSLNMLCALSDQDSNICFGK